MSQQTTCHYMWLYVTIYVVCSTFNWNLAFWVSVMTHISMSDSVNSKWCVLLSTYRLVDVQSLFRSQAANVIIVCHSRLMHGNY